MTPPPSLILVTGASRGLGLAICEHLAKTGYHVVGAPERTPRIRGVAAAARRGRRVRSAGPAQTSDITSGCGDSNGSSGRCSACAQRGHRLRWHPRHHARNPYRRTHPSQSDRHHRADQVRLAQHAATSTRPRDSHCLNHREHGLQWPITLWRDQGGAGWFTRSLAREVGRANITVNSVSPGYMETQMSADWHRTNWRPSCVDHNCGNSSAVDASPRRWVTC